MNEQNTRSGFNQGLILTIIGAGATILAAIIPIIFNRNTPTPVIPTNTAFVQSTDVPTFTALASTTTATVNPTSTFVPATATITSTATPIMGFYDVYLAIDPDGKVPSATFSSEQRVYAVFKINDPTGMGRVKAIWYAVDVPGLDKNAEVYIGEYTIRESSGSISGGGNGAWKAGTYKLELYLNGQLSSTQEFQITD